MPRDIVQPTVNQYGAETHPAFAMIRASRTSQTPGSVLFQSDIRHGHSVRIVIETADRKRNLNHDWVHGGKQLMEIELSEAQWASFVSSMNTSGVPATLRWTAADGQLPELPYDPRLAHSMAEVKEAAAKTFGRIKAAMVAYDALPKDAKAKEKREALEEIRRSVQHAEANLAFTANSLNGYAEDVVSKARADIEAMVQQEAARLGLEPGSVPRELPALDGEVGEK